MVGNIADRIEADLGFDKHIPRILAGGKHVPWPAIGKLEDHGQWDDNLGKYTVPLKSNYLHRAMNYLDTPEASEMFDWQAQWIVEHNCKNVVDVGCRHGPVLDHLYKRDFMDSDFNYFGFDTSTESIQLAKLIWSKFDQVQHVVASWDENRRITPPFVPDVAIFSGVLLYEPESHMELFRRLVKDVWPGTRYAIIQEPLPNEMQQYWLEDMHLHTIQPELFKYKEEYTAVAEQMHDMQIFSGRRHSLVLQL